MKKTILFIVLAFSSYASAQVGINTETPKATLDISASTQDTITTPEGLLIPRVSRDTAQKMTNIEESTLIYIDNASNGTQTGIAINIDTKGFYYYSVDSGNKWVKIKNDSNGSNNTTDYVFNNGLTPSTVNGITTVKLGGELDENTIINANGNEFKISSTIKNAFSVNNVLSVDAEDKRVGIGTNLPTRLLHLTNAYDDPRLPGIIRISDNTQAEGKVLTSDLNGVGTWRDIPQNTTALNGLTPSTTNGITTIKLGGTLLDDTEIKTNTKKYIISSENNGSINNILSVDGSKNNVGIGTLSPRVELDTYGVVANNEQEENITSNMVISKLSQSQLSLKGTSTSNFNVTLPPGVPGQRLVIVNHNASTFDAIIDSKYNIPDGQASEFVYSNGSWIALKGGSRTNVTIYGTTLPIPVFASVVNGVRYVNKTANGLVSPGGDGMWYIVNQKNTQADFKSGSNIAAFNNSRKEIEYEYTGSPFDEDNVFPIVTPGNNSSYNDVFTANVISFKTVGNKTRLKLSIIRADYFSNTEQLGVADYDPSPSNWQGNFYINILLATKFTDL